jgi:diaminopimelate epimerase
LNLCDFALKKEVSLSGSDVSGQHGRWFRAHGLGNDYLAIDEGGVGFELTPPAVRLVCDRHHGIGSDGILVAVDSEVAPFGVRIFNPDGSEAEKSGNGLRIFAAYLLSREQVEIDSPFRVETKGGLVSMTILGESPEGVLDIEAEMGKASFRSVAVGLTGPDREVDGEMLELEGGDRIAINTVSMGNPHCVCFVDEIVAADARRLGPQISSHPWFEHGTNVQLATVTGPGEVSAFIWERGAGETLASGSSSCAVAAAAVRRGLVQEREVDVVMEGGTLRVTVADDWQILLRGPVETVGDVTLTPGFRRRLEGLS